MSQLRSSLLPAIVVALGVVLVVLQPLASPDGRAHPAVVTPTALVASDGSLRGPLVHNTARMWAAVTPAEPKQHLTVSAQPQRWRQLMADHPASWKRLAARLGVDDPGQIVQRGIRATLSAPDRVRFRESDGAWVYTKRLDLTQGDAAVHDVTFEVAWSPRDFTLVSASYTQAAAG